MEADLPADLAPTSRGRLVDAATLEPIPEALVATSRRNDWTDAHGWFDTGDVLDDLGELLVLNVARNTSKHEVPRERWTRLANGWQVPVAIGPTFRVRFAGVEDPPADWEGRLRQEDGREEQWHALRSGPPPYLRYDRPVRGLDEGARTWLELRSEDELLEGRAEVRSLRGIQHVTVEVRERAAVQGRVVDELGEPRGDVAIEAAQFSAAGVERLRGMTGPDGSYRLGAAEPGRMRIVFLPPEALSPTHLDLDVPRGLARAPDVVLASGPAGGSVSGTIGCRSGKRRWFDGFLRLRALDGSGYERVITVGLGAGQTRFQVIDARGSAAEHVSYQPAVGSEAELFLFPDVPAGRYELSVVSRQGFPCSPDHLVVQPPASDLRFTIDDTQHLLSYLLDVREAETGAALESVQASVRCRQQWLALGERLERGKLLIELAEGIDFEWAATAPGHRIVRGSQSDFRGEGTTRSATVDLPRGFGARLVFLDCSQSLGGFSAAFRGAVTWRSTELAGVQVLADGVRVAVSDEHGIAELDLPAPPRRIEFSHAGFRTLDSPGWRGGELLTFPDATVWLVRE